MYSSNPLITGLLMGASIAFLDILLAPRLAGGLSEVFRFLIEGAACHTVYKVTSGGCAAGDFKLDGSLIMQSALGGLTIWLSDFIFRPGMLIGPGMDIIKFLLQGILVYFVFAYSAMP